MIGGQGQLPKTEPANVSLCEGFRMTAHHGSCRGDWGRRRKASSEGTRGRLRDGLAAIAMGIWRSVQGWIWAFLILDALDPNTTSRVGQRLQAWRVLCSWRSGVCRMASGAAGRCSAEAA
jgi:hypothetical protein